MGLARPAVAQGDDVLTAQDVLAARQLHDEHLIEAGNGGEREGVEALGCREACLADPPLDQAALAIDQLQLNQPKQIAGMIDAIAGALAGKLVILAQHRRQFELLEVVGQQKLRCSLGRAGRHRVRRVHAAQSWVSAA